MRRAKVFLAKSRDPRWPSRYVGDALCLQADKVWDAVRDPTTTFYVCGGARTTSVNVREALGHGELLKKRQVYG